MSRSTVGPAPTARPRLPASGFTRWLRALTLVQTVSARDPGQLCGNLEYSTGPLPARGQHRPAPGTAAPNSATSTLPGEVQLVPDQLSPALRRRPAFYRQTEIDAQLHWLLQVGVPGAHSLGRLPG